MEFLGNYPILERVFLFYKPSLERLGITVSVRAKGRGLQLMFAESQWACCRSHGLKWRPTSFSNFLGGIVKIVLAITSDLPGVK